MSEPAGPARARRRRRHRGLIAGLSITLGVLLVAGGLLGYYAWSINNSVTSNIHRGASMPPDSTRPTTGTQPENDNGGTADTGGDHEDQSASSGKPVNFVLMGSDSRDPNDERAGRSDTLMILHLDADRKHAYLISFPRDMWVPIPGHGTAKINAAYAWGGSALTVQTLEQMLDVRMNHVAIVDFDGFIKLTDELGGVTITNDYAFSKKGYHYPKGKITLSGEKALWFVRERKQLPHGDFDRAANQRKVVKAILAKGMSPSVLANPAKFTAFVSGLASSVTVDDGLTDAEIRSLAFSSRGMSPSDIITLQAPVSGTGTSSDGQSIDIVNDAQLAVMAKALRHDDMGAYVKKYPPDESVTR